MKPAYQKTELQSGPTVAPKPVPKPREIDYSGVKVGSRVIHKAFGPGSVTRISEGTILVAFDSMKDLEKRFQFPSAFQQGFLSVSQN